MKRPGSKASNLIPCRAQIKTECNIVKRRRGRQLFAYPDYALGFILRQLVSFTTFIEIPSILSENILQDFPPN